MKSEFREWKRKLAASIKRPNVGAVLLLLDGDTKKTGPNQFCAATVAKAFAFEAKAAGAGTTYSVAVVFARQEFESWLIAGAASFAGNDLPDGRVIASEAKSPDGDLEESPRDAKGWLNGMIEGGYKPTRDQAALTDLVDLSMIRGRNLRSFRRFESALSELILAIRSGKHVATPA